MHVVFILFILILYMLLGNRNYNGGERGLTANFHAQTQHLYEII